MTDPNDLITRANGSPHFGEIDDSIAKAIGRKPGPIYLPHGIEGARGFGNLHVEGHTSRMTLIKRLGFPTFIDYAEFVCGEYERITDGERDRLVLVRLKDAMDCAVVVQFFEDNGSWRISTGIPKRVHRGANLWERVRASGSEPSLGAVEKRPRLETLTLPSKKKKSRQ